MQFTYYKCIAGEVGSYCQLVVTFFFVSPYQTRDNVDHFQKSGSAQPPSYQLLPLPLPPTPGFELQVTQCLVGATLQQAFGVVSHEKAKNK